MSKSKRDYYKVLGIPRNATDDQIRKAYRKLAVKNHPDSIKRDNGTPSEIKAAEERFKDIGEAYAVLSNKEKRMSYDRYGHEAFRPGGRQQGFGFGNTQFRSSGGGFDPSQIFETFFGGNFNDLFGGGTRARQQRDPFSRFNPINATPKPAKGNNVNIQLKLPEDEAKAGISKTITMTINKNGKKEKESIKVKMPPNIQHGKKLRLKGRGKPGKNGGVNGDLYVEVIIVPAIPQKQILRVSLTQALLNKEVFVVTPEKKHKLKLKSGFQNGEKIILKNSGDFIGTSKIRKDLEIELRIVMPNSLTETQKQIVQQLDQSF